MSDEVTAEEDDLIEKSHTFRKRRLTLTSRYVDAPLLEMTSADEETEKLETTVNASSPSNQDDNNGKTKNFRKRRLTLTKNDQIDFDALENTTDIANQLPTKLLCNDNSEEEPYRKKRRLSGFSHASNLSCSTLGSKTHHAGEILRHPSSPSAAQAENRLYAPPFNIEKEETEEEKKSQPVWKRRMTRHYSEDETRLPFPRHIVGQYSCHGTEPVYDSDFDNDSDEKSDEEETNWQVGTSPEEINGNDNLKRAKHDEENGSNEQIQLTHVPESPPIKLTTSAKINQDRGGITFPYGNCDKTALFAVYDGHGQGGELFRNLRCIIFREN